MKYLVGYTGFVGSNLAHTSSFDGLYNSKNIKDAFGTNPDLLVYAGVRAEKFLANKDPQLDLQQIKIAIENIKNIKPKTLVLISTIDVYKYPVNVDEDTLIETEELHAYGLNRYYLEKWVEENITDYLIVRLPGLYGNNIKKNFIYDLLNIVPSMLSEELFLQVTNKEPLIQNYYKRQENGFYKCINIEEDEKNKLRQMFSFVGFSSLNFTDSRGSFQFYNLKFLWKHIEKAIKHKIKKINIATEPVSASELFEYIYCKSFTNKLSKQIPNYDFKTKYTNTFNGKDGYIFPKKFILDDIKNFIIGVS